MDICGDNRFEIIDAAKEALMKSTNIESRPAEMDVLDSFLFRAWQMGWLGKYEPDYKERMKGEYRELKERHEKLADIILKYEAGTLGFEPDCPLELLRNQETAMGWYLNCLIGRAEIEGISL